MCGIFGTRENLIIDTRRLVSASLRHRGPDAQNFCLVEPWTFFHSRLAIIDLAGGMQPLESQRLCMIFNGEIYNYRTLAKQYNLGNNRKSDTEVIALLYEKLGCEAFSKLHGMFAIALFDRVSHRLILARDRTGKKPLYWSSYSSLTFASEMKALFAAGIPKTVSSPALLQHLRHGFVSGEHTVYQHVHELLPGHYYEFDSQGQLNSKTKFWSIEDVQINAKSSFNALNTYKSSMTAVDQSLRSAVESRMLASDLEVGAFLSSGIDSSLICSYAAEVNPNIRTFTVRTDAGIDESGTAAAIAKKLGIRNQALTIDMARLSDEYPSIVAAYDEPIVDESIVPSFYVAKAAKEFVTVVLTGDGGDEIFGGYRRHVIYRYLSLLRRFRYQIHGLSRLLSVSQAKSNSANFANRLGRTLFLPKQQQYWSLTTDLFFDAPSVLDESRVEALSYDPFYVNDFDTGITADIHGILPKILLKKIDIATMQHSLEARCPMLDTNFIETAFCVNRKHKVSGFTTKKLLRSLMQQRLGGEFSELPKRGFEINVRTLIDDTLRNISHDCLQSSSPYFANLIDHDYIKSNYLKAGKIDDVRRYKGLLALLNLELWHRSLATK